MYQAAKQSQKNIKSEKMKLRGWGGMVMLDRCLQYSEHRTILLSVCVGGGGGRGTILLSVRRWGGGGCSIFSGNILSARGGGEVIIPYSREIPPSALAL